MLFRSIIARPDIEQLEPHALRWEGDADKEKDWMTPLAPATDGQSNDATGREYALSPLSGVFEHLTQCPEPMGYQIVFEPKRDWSTRKESYLYDVRQGNDGGMVDSLVQDIFPETDTDAFQQEEPDKAKALQQKSSSTTFTANVRALSFSFDTDVGENPRDRSGTDQANLFKEELSSLMSILDPLNGDYYKIQGRYPSAAKERHGLAEHYLNREIISSEGDSSLLEFFGTAHWPELILDPQELASLFLIPPSQYLSRRGRRGIQSKHIEQEPLPKPAPDILNRYKDIDGLKLGYAMDEDRELDTDPIAISTEKLNEHYLRAASTGHGKSIGVLNDMLSLREDTEGPNVLVDPKGGLMCYNYLRCHYAKFGNLDNVYFFRVPEDLPAIPFFDIRPQLENGKNRETAVQDTVEHFHDLMRMIMGYSTYDNAFVAKEIISFMIRAMFDKKHGHDSFTFDELREALDEYHERGEIPKVSEDNSHIEDTLVGKYRNSTEEDFNASMDAVMNRLNKVDRMRSRTSARQPERERTGPLLPRKRRQEAHPVVFQ